MNNMYARLLSMLLLVFVYSHVANAQELEISGKVIAAEDGSGLPGVGVVNITTKTEIPIHCPGWLLSYTSR